MCALLHLAHRAGTEIIIENPADRGDLSQPNYFLNASHGPLWLMPAICALIKRTSAKTTVTFAMCAFGAPWQKATTLLYTAGFDAWLDVLRERRCEHTALMPSWREVRRRAQAGTPTKRRHTHLTSTQLPGTGRRRPREAAIYRCPRVTASDQLRPRRRHT